jgi:hypothetical protein
MVKNNSTNDFISQIQVSDSEKYYLNAKYWEGKPFKDCKIDGQSIYDSGDISIFKKYNAIDSLSSIEGLEPNTKYIFTSPVTSEKPLSFENINWGNSDYSYCEYAFIFSSGAVVTTTDFIFPEDWYWSNGEEPFIEPNMRYELNISVIKDSGNNNIVHAILVPFVQVKVVANNE